LADFSIQPFSLLDGNIREAWTRLVIILAGAIAAIQAGAVLIGLAVDPLLREMARGNGPAEPKSADFSRGLDREGS